MRKILKILIPLVILGALYQFRAPLGEQLAPILDNAISYFFAKTPCAEPIPYKLGTFDAKFGISQKYFLSALSDAEAVWEKSYGKELFSYAPSDYESDVLRINLIYDYRQEATGRLAGLGITVNDNRASYDMLKIKLTDLKTKFASAKNNYDTGVKDYNEKLQTYEDLVKYWNSKGGAPQAEYDKLQTEKAALDAEASGLQNSEARINEMVSEINSMVVVLNRLADTLNLVVEKYNTVGASRGESFEEGVYTSDGINSQIDIYEFSSRAKLVRVLAHELGHALGLDHVNDPKAIMYELNQGNNETLTAADLKALDTKCGVK